MAYSPDGSYLAAGASCIRAPDISIWSITENDKGRMNYKYLYSLEGHKYGIQSIFFSPNSEYMVSIGDHSDKGVFVWDTKIGQRDSTI